MAIDPGTLLSVGGKLLGGLFGRKKRKNSVQQIVNDAKAAGIHPLAALGSPAAANYASPVGSSPFGDAVADGMDTLGRSISNRRSNRLDNELRTAQIDTERAKAEALRAEATSRTRISTARGTGSKPIPLWVEYVDRDGNIQWGPNPSIPDLEQMPVPGMIHGTDAIVGDTRPVVIRGGKKYRLPPPPVPNPYGTSHSNTGGPTGFGPKQRY